jgi:hypothetical protein
VFAQHGQLRVQFVDPHAGHSCRRGLVWASDLGWGIGLQIPGVEVAGPTAKQDINAGLDTTTTGICRIDASGHRSG